MTLLHMFIASFVLIFIRAFQSRNVIFDHYIAILPTSLVFAAVEMYVIINVVKQGYSINMVLAIGLGAGLGSLAAMFSHKKVFNKDVTTNRRQET